MASATFTFSLANGKLTATPDSASSVLALEDHLLAKAIGCEPAPPRVALSASVTTALARNVRDLVVEFVICVILPTTSTDPSGKS